MKRTLLLIAALLLWLPLARAQYRDPLSSLEDTETVHALKEHVAYLSSAALEGRKAGSEGEQLAADYLAEKLKEYGIDVLSPAGGSTFGIAREGADTLTSRNVLGFLQGWDKELNQRYIVIGARMDNLGMDTYTVDGEPVRRIYYGANGNASGMALLLELAQKLSYARTLLRRSILFVGFGASQETFAGSWYFLHRSFRDADKIDAMVNLDMVGMGSGGFYAYTSSNGDLNAIVNALQGELLPVQASLTPQEPYPGTTGFSTTRRSLPSSLPPGATRSTTRDGTALRPWILRIWNGSWNMSIPTSSTWPTAPGRSSATTPCRPGKCRRAPIPMRMWT
ncbi:MAG: M28 family peptidase [Bacteroidales bacterium]|nr:M28 family peptidase [Bacteroidales bacterium]